MSGREMIDAPFLYRYNSSVIRRPDDLDEPPMTQAPQRQDERDKSLGPVSPRGGE